MVRIWSYCSRAMKPPSTSFRYRSSSTLALLCWAVSRARLASACFTAAWYWASVACAWSSAAWTGRGSIVKSRAPAETSSPSANPTSITSPFSMERTDTVASGCTLPMARTCTGTSRWATVVTVTGTAGAGAVAVAEPAPRSHPASGGGKQRERDEPARQHRAETRPGSRRVPAGRRHARLPESAAESSRRNAVQSRWNTASDEVRPITRRVTWGNTRG